MKVIELIRSVMKYERGGTLRVVSEKIEKKGLAAVVTGEGPSLETNHLCSRRVLFIGKLKKTGKLLFFSKF